jgi:hypothetical protein
MADTPDADDTELRQWFHRHLDGLTPPGLPFDRARFHAETLERLRRERPARRLRIPWVTAVAASLVLAAWWWHGGTGQPYGSLAGSTPHPSATAPSTMFQGVAPGLGARSSPANKTAQALDFMVASRLPRQGSLTVVGVAPLVFRMANVATEAAVPRIAPRLLRLAQPVAPGHYHCPLHAASPTRLLLEQGHALYTLSVFVDGCRWFTLERGRNLAPIPTRMLATAEAAHRLYWMPPDLVRLVKQLGVGAR